MKNNNNKIKYYEATWYEVFRKNDDDSTETIFSNDSLEACVKVYRKEKLMDKSIKIDKWLKASYLQFPIPIQSILN
jgi:hypothetical protein